MTDSTVDLKQQLRDPNYTPPIAQAVPLGIQHVLAMFVSNVTPAIIVAGAAGFGFGSNSPDFPNLIYMIQMSMLFAGIATLFQTIGMGPVGARLPIVQGTSFAFLPVMIPIVAGQGVAAMGTLMGGIVIGGVFHFLLGTFIGRLRFALPPLVTGLIVLMIGLALIKVGIQYAAGGVPAMGKPEFGSLQNWTVALFVIVVTLGIKFFMKGMWSIAAVLLGLIAGYLLALALGMVNFGNVGNASWFSAPMPFKWGFDFTAAAIIGMCFMAIISAIETVGDVSGITKGGAGREATDKENFRRHLCGRFGNGNSRHLRRIAQHILQSECRTYIDDRGDEPPRCDLWCDLPDCLRPDTQDRRHNLHRSDRGFGRRRDRHVWHGCGGRHQYAV